MSIELSSKGEELLKAYRQEAMEALVDEQNAKRHFDEIVETASKSTGVSKTEISAYYKSVFNEKIDPTIARAEFWQRLGK